jgi:hypothetical protein
MGTSQEVSSLAVYNVRAEENAAGEVVQHYIAYGLALRVAVPTAGTTYVGEALPGTGETTAKWRIKKIVESGSNVTITWAGGTDAFASRWDQRASLTYT